MVFALNGCRSLMLTSCMRNEDIDRKQYLSLTNTIQILDIPTKEVAKFKDDKNFNF